MDVSPRGGAGEHDLRDAGALVADARVVGGDTDAEVRGEEGLVRAESEEVEALGGGESRDARGVAFEERAPALGPRDAPQVLREATDAGRHGARLRSETNGLEGGGRGARGGAPYGARQEMCDGVTPAARRRLATGLRMRGGAVVRASLEIVAGRIPPRETREGVARAGPGQTERRERRRARETRRRRATRARSSARARGRRTRGIPVPGRRSRSRKTSSSVQDPLETSETMCVVETITALMMVDRHARVANVAATTLSRCLPSRYRRSRTRRQRLAPFPSPFRSISPHASNRSRATLLITLNRSGPR